MRRNCGPLIGALIALSAVAAQAQPASSAGPDDLDRAMLEELNALPINAPQSIWAQQFDQAKSREDKLMLLRRAWDNFQDPTLSDTQRSAWHDAWLWGYKKAAIEDAMPNPYEH